MQNLLVKEKMKMSEQIDATKDSTGEPTSPHPIQSVAEFIKKRHRTIQKTYIVFGMDYPKFVDHIL